MSAKSTETFIQGLISENRPAFKLVYVVELGYLNEYAFDNVGDALTFAKSALISQDRNTEISVNIKKVYPEIESEAEQEETENEEE